MLWQLSKANPILSEATDCIQSTDYLHSKPDLLVNLDSPDPCSHLKSRVRILRNISPALKPNRPRSGSIYRKAVSEWAKMRGREIIKFDHLRETKDLAAARTSKETPGLGKSGSFAHAR
jgi:hypothetical protein